MIFDNVIRSTRKPSLEIAPTIFQHHVAARKMHSCCWLFTA